MPRRPLLLAITAILLCPSGSAQAYTLKRTDSGRPVRWVEDTVPIRVEGDMMWLLPGGQVRESLQIATDAWRGLPRVPDLVIEEGEPGAPGYDPERPQNGVHLVHDWPYDPEQLAVTVTTYHDETGEVLDADILINASHPFALVPEGGTESRDRSYDLASVLTHEMGHFLGLGETEDPAIATMWPLLERGSTHQRTIEEDDERGVIALYHGTYVTPPIGCQGASVAGRPGRGPFPFLVAALGLIAVVRRCRRTPKM